MVFFFNSQIPRTAVFANPASASLCPHPLHFVLHSCLSSNLVTSVHFWKAREARIQHEKSEDDEDTVEIYAA